MLPKPMKDRDIPFSEYMKIKEAAQFLGVHPDTLRRWERNQKITSRRHPLNRYRLYEKEELARVLQTVRVA